MARDRTGDTGRTGRGDAARGAGAARPARRRVSPAGQGGVSRRESAAREASLVDRIEAYLKRQPHCWVRKTHGSGYTAGLPDLIGCLRGRFFAIEVKRPGEQPTALQAQELRRIRQAYGFALWVDTYEAVVYFVREAP